jgi:NitT/TauT family transport system permease protein
VLGFAFFFTVMFFEWLALHKWHESAVSGSETNR